MIARGFAEPCTCLVGEAAVVAVDACVGPIHSALQSFTASMNQQIACYVLSEKISAIIAIA